MNDEKEKFVGITLPWSLIKKLQGKAGEKERSLSAQIRYILKHWGEENEEDKG